MHVFVYAGGVTPAERLAGPGTTVFHGHAAAVWSYRGRTGLTGGS